MAQFLGGPPTAVPSSYVAASPVDQLSPDDPPTFLVHGASDTLVPVSQSEELATALTVAGVPNRLVVIPRAGHELDFPIRTPRIRNLVFQILAFLDATWNDKVSSILNKPLILGMFACVFGRLTEAGLDGRRFTEATRWRPSFMWGA